MRKVLCSIGHGAHAPLLALSRPTFERYAERHGYALEIRDEVDPSRPAAWSKIALLLELVPNYELLVWIDADALVVDPELDIADALPTGRELGLVRHRRGGQLVPNTGVMVLRGGLFAQELLGQVWDRTELLAHPWWENAALMRVLGYSLPPSLESGLRGRLHRIAGQALGRELRPARPRRPSPFLERTAFLSTEWNSIWGDAAEHPRIVHFLGTPVAQRLNGMTALLAELEAHHER
jgi:hypothetical protein